MSGDKTVSLTLFFQGVLNNRVPKMMHDAADALKQLLVAKLNHPGSGKAVRSRRAGSPAYGPPDAAGKRKRLPDNPADFHNPSVKGEPPAPDTTNLRDSATSVRKGFLRWEVGVHAPGAASLEEDMGRPYLKPATEDWRQTAGKKFAEAPRA